jgi:magnesium-transporting ATPase (P-type)
MEGSMNYPDWYRSFRAFLLGAASGVVLLIGLQQFQIVPAPLSSFSASMILLFTQMPVALVLAVFEIGFAIARYRRMRREMDSRTTLA